MRTWRNGLILPFVLLLLWYLITARQIFSPYLLPSPAATASTAAELIAGGMLWQHLWISLQRVARRLFLLGARRHPFGYSLWTQQQLPGLLLASAGISAPCTSSGSYPPDHFMVRHRRRLQAGYYLFGLFLSSVLKHLQRYQGLRPQTIGSRYFAAFYSLAAGQADPITCRTAIHRRRPATFAGLQLACSYRRRIDRSLLRHRLYDPGRRTDVAARYRFSRLFAIGIVGSLIDWLFLALTNKLLPWNVKAGEEHAA